MKKMKLTPIWNILLNIKMHKLEIILGSIVSGITFICTYFWNITLENHEQFIGLLAVILLDGIFGIIAGTKNEGFQTRKAIKILRTTFIWITILSVLLSIEKGFAGMSWLSETITIPFIILQLISALKNASMAGYIKSDELNHILDQIDIHKGSRKIKHK